MLFSLLCSPFSSHFFVQKLLSKSLLSFSKLLNPVHIYPPFYAPLGILLKHPPGSFRDASPAQPQGSGWREEGLGSWPVWPEPAGSQPSGEIHQAIHPTAHLPTGPSSHLQVADASSTFPDTLTRTQDEAPACAPSGSNRVPPRTPARAPPRQRRRSGRAGSDSKPQQMGYNSPQRLTCIPRIKICIGKNKSIHVIYGVLKSSG